MSIRFEFLGAVVIVYLVATDSLGYTHELPLWHYESLGAVAEPLAGMETIRDAEGNVLYGKALQ